jgi:hypothetical protein
MRGKDDNKSKVLQMTDYKVNVGFSVNVQKKGKGKSYCAFCGKEVVEGRYNVCVSKKLRSWSIDSFTLGRANVTQQKAGSKFSVRTVPEVVWFHRYCIPELAVKMEQIEKDYGGKMALETL